MSENKRETLRDPARPAVYYQAFVAREQEEILAYTKHNNPVLFPSVARKCVRIGVALYSEGAEVLEIYKRFGEAATYQRRFLVEGKQFKLGGIGTIDDYLELFSSAFLAGQSDELIEVLKQCTYTETPRLFETRLLGQFCDMLEGRPVKITTAEVAELESIKKEWACLPVLFSAVSAKVIPKAATALDDYLANSWGPPIEKWAKKALKSTTTDYCGKWSIFSAAVCKILGTVPGLSEKSNLYVPVDLVGA